MANLDNSTGRHYPSIPPNPPISNISNDGQNQKTNSQSSSKENEKKELDFSLATGRNGSYLLINLLPESEIPENYRRRAERAGTDIRANFYNGPLQILAIGHDYSRYGMHILIHSAVKDILQKAVADGKLLQGLSTDEQAEIIDYPYVAGFVSETLKIRIEDRPTDWVPGDRKGFRDICEKYRKAISMAENYCSEHGGTFSISFCEKDYFSLAITKTLGVLHKVNQEAEDGEQYIKKSRQYLPEGTFFDTKRGTRYKTIEQFQNDLFGGNPNFSNQPEENFPRYRNREACLRYLYSLAELMHPSCRNNDGKREAQFLLLHPDSNRMISEAESRGKYELRLHVIADRLAKHLYTQEAWIEHIDEVESVLKVFIHNLKNNCASIMHSDNFKDGEWIDIMSSILNGSIELHKDKLGLGGGFHTPLEAIHTGEFVTAQDGTRHYKYCDGLSQSYKDVIERVFESFPQAHNADWFCVCRPQIPLTQDDLPPAVIKKFRNYEDDSLVVLFGRIDEEETRLVVRHDPYSIETWNDRHTSMVTRLRSELSPEELTDLVHRFKDWQAKLFNNLLQVASRNQSPHLPPFEIHGNYLIRNFLDGKVCSRMNRNELSYKTISAVMRLLGPICASYYIAQRTSLAFHELLLDGIDDRKSPLSLLPIGLSETFCTQQPSPRDYNEDAASLYGAHVASWISSFLHGKHAAHLPPHVKAKAAKKLLARWSQSFKDSLSALAESASSLGFNEVQKDYEKLDKVFRLQGKKLPKDFNLCEFIPFSQKLLDAIPEEIDHIVDSFRLNAKDFLEIFDEFMEVPRSGTKFEEKERLNAAIYSILNNHLSTKYASSVERLLYNRIVDFQSCSLVECESLLTLADITTRLIEIIGPNQRLHTKTKILLDVGQKEGISVKDFCSAVRSLPSDIRLSHYQAERFYHALNGLRSCYIQAKTKDERSRIIYYAKAVTFGLIDLSSLQGSEEDDEFYFCS